MQNQQNAILKGIAGLLGVALLVLVIAQARNAFEKYDYIGKVETSRDTIVVEGEGKVVSKPDLAKIQLGVQTDGASVKEIQKTNTQKMNAIIAAMSAFGVDKKDIQTSSYTIYPQYNWTNNRQTLSGYTVSQQVTVKVRDLDRAGDVLAKAGELGANQIGGLEFTIDEPKALQEEARKKAIEDAKKKAEALADELGLRIVKVVTFSESMGGVRPPMPMYAKAEMAQDAGANVAPSIEAGSTDVMSNVQVTFEVK